MKNNKHAFTLMEILLVTMLIAVIGIATANVFSNGLKLWAKSNQVIKESDLMIFFDKFGEDIRSVQLVSGINFKGIGGQFAFPSLVLTSPDPRSSRAFEDVVDQIGAVRYRFDPAEKKIYRAQANYSQALKAQWGDEVELVVGIEELNFRYILVSSGSVLEKAQIDAEVPLGVSLEVRFEGDNYERRLRRFFPLMIGGGA